MKIAVRYGHLQTPSGDGGAVGYVKETDVNRRYGALVISKLQALGNEVLNVTPPEANRSLSDSLNYGINKANEWGADLFISCHVNAFQYVDYAMGCEVVVGSQKGYDLGTKVVNELTSLGFKSRGAKYDTRGLAEIRGTNMPCIICEPFFLDSKFDVDLYNKVGDEGIANAIVKGVCGKLPNIISSTTNQEPKIKEEFDMENIVLYANQIDKRACEYLADVLKCPIFDANIPYDYSKIKNIYCIGGKPSIGWTGYAKEIITGKDRFETMQLVLNKIKQLGA